MVLGKKCVLLKLGIWIVAFMDHRVFFQKAADKEDSQSLGTCVKKILPREERYLKIGTN